MISHLLGASGPVLGDDHVWSLSAQSFGHDHLVITAASKFPDRSRKGIEKRSGKGLQTKISPFADQEKYVTVRSNLSEGQCETAAATIECNFPNTPNARCSSMIEAIYEQSLTTQKKCTKWQCPWVFGQSALQYSITFAKQAESIPLQPQKKEIAQHDTQSQAKC